VDRTAIFSIWVNRSVHHPRKVKVSTLLKIGKKLTYTYKKKLIYDLFLLYFRSCIYLRGPSLKCCYSEEC
jgi:hypothetical protein